MFIESYAPIDFDVRGETVRVSGIEHLVCENCGNEVYKANSASDLQRAAHELYRQRHGYLSGSEIKSIRAKYSVSQEEFEHIIGAGSKTLTRWENESVMQPGVANVLLKVLDRFPLVFSWLRDENLVMFCDSTSLSYSGLEINTTHDTEDKVGMSAIQRAAEMRLVA
jgi:putative zinc finger/helix-turn-helix YgiT family protein